LIPTAPVGHMTPQHASRAPMGERPEHAQTRSSEAVCALQRQREDALSLKALRRQIDAGIAALEASEFTEVADAELDTYFDDLAAQSVEQAQ
jgi:hypothetical protein